ncbi:MAG: RNA pseudouridine synthase [Verrucomicrobiales bacterium]|nr:RNA pseudouridine synthase [Verrucomicrobiales bacterium]MCP5557302.1 RNA pseudouridine synthase [Verrucomicrobiaceae bacterium]
MAFDPHFTVLDETADYIVVNKPAPLQAHPSNPGCAPTLWDGLRELLAFEIVNGGQVSIINRLDRETSGVTLIAKNAAAARQFGLAMQARQFHKSYLAVVLGWPEWEVLRADGPILRKGEVMPSPIWVKQMVHPDGAPCETNFRVLERGGSTALPLSLVEAMPVTGRMHQIRVHLSHLGHPILGDKIYGQDETCYLDFIDTGWSEDLAGRLHLKRQALHAHRLGLVTDTLTAEWVAPCPDLFASALAGRL